MGATYLSPEDLQLLEGAPGLQAQEANLRRQLDAAAALRGRTMPQHTTPWGTLLGGLGTIASDLGGFYQQSQLQPKLESLLGQEGKAAGVGARLKALMDQQKLSAGQQELDAGKAEADAKAAELARATNPTGARATLGGDLLKRLGMKPPAGATPADYVPMLPLIEKASETEQRGKDRAAALSLRKQMAGESGAAALSPEALDQLATQFAQTGQLPAMGFGKDAAAVRLKIANRAAELFGGNDLAQAKASFGANSGALKQLQLQADRVDAFERTAIANLDQALAAATKVVDVGSPFFNAPLRTVQQRLAGSPDMQRYITARQVAVQEVAKVLSGALGNQSVSDSARHEVESLLGPDASLAQIKAAADVLKVDMGNRKAAMQAQLAEIRGRRVGGGDNTPAEAPNSSMSGMVDVVSPEGVSGRIPAAKLEAALARGFKRAGP